MINKDKNATPIIQQNPMFYRET